MLEETEVLEDDEEPEEVTHAKCLFPSGSSASRCAVQTNMTTCSALPTTTSSFAKIDNRKDEIVNISELFAVEEI